MILKKAIALLCLICGISNFTYAWSYQSGICSPQSVTIPCQANLWDFGFETFWVQATSNYQYFATVINAPGGSLDNRQILNIDPNFVIGYQLSVGYQYSTARDISLSWETLHEDNADDRVLAANETRISSGTTPFTSTVAGSVASGRNDIEFDAVNFEMGQAFQMGNSTTMRLHTGLQLARIDYTMVWELSNPAIVHSRQTVISTFDGLGIRSGADFNYILTHEYSVNARVAGSLLVGDILSSDRAIQPAPLFSQFEASYNTTIPTALVPSLAAKMGIHTVWDILGGQLLMELGWRWEAYYHVLHRFPTSTARDSELNNFHFHGVYWTFKYFI